MDDGKMFFLALTMLGAMSLGVIAWKACRFLGAMVSERMERKGFGALTKAMREPEKDNDLGM